MIYPSIAQFTEYSGENISNKLKGDKKNPVELWETLCKRCERVIRNKLPGIKTADLTDEQVVQWQELIMEQAEYFFSVGDKSLMDDKQTSNLSDEVVEMAKQAELWSPWL